MGLLSDIFAGIIGYTLPEATPFVTATVKKFGRADNLVERLENLDEPFEVDDTNITEHSIFDKLSDMDSSLYSYADDEDELPFNVEYEYPDQNNDEVDGWEDVFADAFDYDSFHNDYNIDGTLMVDDAFDINGDPYGCPESLCGDD